MQNITLELPNIPGMLATMGETLGKAGISLEGGGVFGCGANAIANFLVRDGAAARTALEAAGLRVVAVRDVLIQRLNQGVPGQLGLLTRRMAEAGVNIEIQYSDHDNQLILVVDDMEKGRAVSREWEAAR